MAKVGRGAILIFPIFELPLKYHPAQFSYLIDFNLKLNYQKNAKSNLKQKNAKSNFKQKNAMREYNGGSPCGKKLSREASV